MLVVSMFYSLSCFSLSSSLASTDRHNAFLLFRAVPLFYQSFRFLLSPQVLVANTAVGGPLLFCVGPVLFCLASSSLRNSWGIGGPQYHNVESGVVL